MSSQPVLPTRIFLLAGVLLTAASTMVQAQTTIEPLPAPAYNPNAYISSPPTYLPPVNQQYPSLSQQTPASRSPYTVPMQPGQQMQQVAQQPQQPTGQTHPTQVAGAPYLQYAQESYSPPSPDSYGAPLQMNAPQQDGNPGVVGSGANRETFPLPQPSAEPSDAGADMSLLTPLPSEGYTLEPEHPWYHYPWIWIPSDGWDNSIEFGLNGSSGNAESLSYATGADLNRRGELYNLAVRLNYRKTSSAGLITQDNARANFDLDRAINQTAFSAFVKSGLEYDQFKAFDARVNVNSGLSYFWLNTDQATVVTRVGTGASQEIGAVNDDWKPEMLFGADVKHQVNKRNRVFAKADYFPAFEDFSDYRVVTDAGWEILLDDAQNFSLKLAATNRYDSTPLGLKPQDIDYAATLLYKF